MFRRWARLVSREDLTEDERCKDDISRGNNYALINEAMTSWCAARTKEQAIAELEEARVPCGPVYDLDEVLADPQVRIRNLIEEVEFPGGTRPVPIAAPPARVTETLPGRATRAPTLGEHTSEVLTEIGREAGLSQKTLQAFRETREGDAALVGSEERLRGFGVRNVPNLLFGGRVLVPGTVNVDTYVLALDQALFPSSEEEAQEKPTLH